MLSEQQARARVLLSRLSERLWGNTPRGELAFLSIIRHDNSSMPPRYKVVLATNVLEPEHNTTVSTLTVWREFRPYWTYLSLGASSSALSEAERRAQWTTARPPFMTSLKTSLTLTRERKNSMPPCRERLRGSANSSWPAPEFKHPSHRA